MKKSALKSILYFRKLPARRISLLVVGLITLLRTSNLEAALIHQYELNGSYADTLGGSSLAPGGVFGTGTLNATDYSFGASQGLSLANALPSDSTYSILLDFKYSDLNGYRKIVDFKNLSSDSGLYNFSTAVVFYPGIIGAAGAFQPDVFVRLVLTREASNNEFTGYIDGFQQLSFVDGSGVSVFDAANNVIQLFNDDAYTASEASAGVVDRIEIYNTALTPLQVAALGGSNAIPEPNSFILTCTGLVILIGACKRRFKQAVV